MTPVFTARAVVPRFVISVMGLRTVAEHNAHEDWHVKDTRRKKQHERVLEALNYRSYRCPFALPITVTLTRLSSGTLDTFDNLPSALKHVADIVAWWARGRPFGPTGKPLIGQADRDENAIRFVAAQEKTKRGVYGVRIEVEARR